MDKACKKHELWTFCNTSQFKSWDLNHSYESVWKCPALHPSAAMPSSSWKWEHQNAIRSGKSDSFEHLWSAGSRCLQHSEEAACISALPSVPDTTKFKLRKQSHQVPCNRAVARDPQHAALSEVSSRSNKTKCSGNINFSPNWMTSATHSCIKCFIAVRIKNSLSNFVEIKKLYIYYIKNTINLGKGS